jgi:hypothetical protein
VCPEGCCVLSNRLMRFENYDTYYVACDKEKLGQHVPVSRFEFELCCVSLVVAANH